MTDIVRGRMADIANGRDCSLIYLCSNKSKEEPGPDDTSAVSAESEHGPHDTPAVSAGSEPVDEEDRTMENGKGSYDEADYKEIKETKEP